MCYRVGELPLLGDRRLPKIFPLDVVYWKTFVGKPQVVEAVSTTWNVLLMMGMLEEAAFLMFWTRTLHLEVLWEFG